MAAVGLVAVWGAMLFAVPLTLDAFKDFKVEMPGLTMLTVSTYHSAGSLVLLMLALATALLLGLRQWAGWMLALVLCGACDLAGLGLFLPVVALVNNLNGGDGAPAPVSPGSVVGSNVGFWLALGALLFNQILFVLLLRKRREFLVSPQSNGPLLPIK